MFIAQRLLERNHFLHLTKKITVQTFFASCRYSFFNPLVSAIDTAFQDLSSHQSVLIFNDICVERTGKRGTAPLHCGRTKALR
ncbi:MAG: hypothetical protein WCL21_18430, partial [Mariniphaga sp.]